MTRSRHSSDVLRAAILLALALAPLACRTSSGPTVVAVAGGLDAGAADAGGADAGSAGPAISLSPSIPGDVTFGSTFSLASLQEDFDIFSWNSFISVNWPPGRDGGGDPARKIGDRGDNATVWEGWHEASSIFLPGGATPSGSGDAGIPAACKNLYAPGMRVLRQVGKTPNLLSETIQPFNTGPLIDQQGHYARFEISVNQPMFDYILQNKLYSKAGQQAFSSTVKFPCGANGTDAAEGAIMVKAAWKVLDDPAAQRERFHTADALIYTPPSKNPPVKEQCSKGVVGLVGFHIGHKNDSAAQWVWSTFEHADNAPTQADVKSGSLKPRYNFYDPTCKDCPVNEPAPRPWDPNKNNPHHTQVVRIDTLDGNDEFAASSARARNAVAKALLLGVNAKSVWQHYELVSTQWPTDTKVGQCEAKATNPNGTPAPSFLANTTLETFVQGKVPNVSSSCIGCHGNAAMTTGKASDFTYLLERAQ